MYVRSAFFFSTTLYLNFWNIFYDFLVERKIQSKWTVGQSSFFIRKSRSQFVIGSLERVRGNENIGPKTNLAVLCTHRTPFLRYQKKKKHFIFFRIRCCLVNWLPVDECWSWWNLGYVLWCLPNDMCWIVLIGTHSSSSLPVFVGKAVFAIAVRHQSVISRIAAVHTHRRLRGHKKIQYFYAHTGHNHAHALTLWLMMVRPSSFRYI